MGFKTFTRLCVDFEMQSERISRITYIYNKLKDED